MSLDGKIALVTGASRGIGRAISAALLERGATVAMLARTRETLEAAAAELGGRAVPVPADVSDPEAVRGAFEEVETRFGRLDILVNNAGWSALGRIEDLDDAQIAATIGVNLLAPIYTTRSAVPLLRAAGGGDIVNISSESTMLPMPHLSLYAASKAGLEVFSRASAQELKAEDIRVMTLVAGATRTEWGSDWGAEGLERFLETANASGHLAMISALSPQEPEEVAEAVAFLVTRPRGQIVDVIHVRAHAGRDGSS